MDQLRALHAFVRVAELTSFTAAGQQLGVTQPQISRAVRQLERGIGSQLFTRSTRRVVLTPEGQRYLSGVREALRTLEAARNAMRAASRAVSGTLQVTAPVAFGDYLAPVVAELAASHPDLAIDAVLTDRVVDVIDEGFDVAIRMAPMAPSTLRTRRLGTSRAVLCAAPAYLERRGAPRRVRDLAAHDFVIFTAKRTADRLTLIDRRGRTTVVRIAGRLRSNELRLVRHAALAAAGIAALPVALLGRALEDGQLVRVLPGWTLPAAPIHAVFPPRSPQPARLIAFLDAMARSLRGTTPARVS
jgi:DNA-binding transcriptional LysR family regulator